MQSIKVMNDLIDCIGNGLVIGTGNIWVDLNGHTIDGKGIDGGIVNMGFDSVTITNGTVHEFDYGVLLNPGTGLNVVEKIHAELNQEAGIALADADQQGKGNDIRNNTLLQNGAGIWLLSGTKNALIRGNALGGSMKDGILLEHSTGTKIRENEITGSGGNGVVLIASANNTIVENEISLSGQMGIALGEELLPSNNNVVSKNLISEGGGGVSIIDSSGNQILVNRVADVNGAGVAMELARNTLVRGNDFGSSKSGIEIEESSDNTIESNNASGTLGTGIAIGDLSARNDVLRNTTNSNSGEGIAIESSAPAGQGTRIEGNTADANGGDGIYIAGVGHILKDNRATLNGGWGMYAAAGVIDEGGNWAGGNTEPNQCYNVVCTIGSVPGEPDTWIVDKPPLLSHSRNASFTFRGTDDINLEHELVFECRLDTTDPLAWEDCEYPAEFLNLMPGSHTIEIRTIDLTLLADSTPARYTWTYQPLPPNDPPEVILDITPPLSSFVLDAIFTFHSNEPDVTFECKVDFWGYEPCGFESAQYMAQGAFEWGLGEEEAGTHTFYVRATDFEGNVGEPTTYEWELLGIVTKWLPGPEPETTGFTPPETPLDPATGGETLSTRAVIDFEANVADATYECSIDLEPFETCVPPVTYTGLIAGDHNLRVVASSGEMTELEPAEYEWSIIDPIDQAPPETFIDLRPQPQGGTSSTKFQFSGTDDLTPPELLIFECRVDSTNALDWQECVSPFNLLDLYTYEDIQLAPGEHTFEVRAIDMAENPFENPNDPNPNFEGNPDPTPATYTWTMTADTTPPVTGITIGPADGEKVGLADSIFEFFGNDNATPIIDLEFQCSIDGEPWLFDSNGRPEANCDSPYQTSGLLPGVHNLKIRAIDLAGNVDPTPAERTWTLVPMPITTITSGPAVLNLEGELFSTSESAVFTFRSDQPGSTFECALDEGGPNLGDVEPWVRCDSGVAAFFRLDNGEHKFEVRATNPEGVVEEPPVVYEWIVELGPDLTPPNTTITSGPPAVDLLTVATFEFTGTDNRNDPLVFECALDGVAFNSCTSPDQWSDLVRGDHVLLVRARDAAGNYDPTPARYEWIVAAPPLSVFTQTPAELTEDTHAKFVFQADVPGSTFWCWLDGVLMKGAAEGCASPFERDLAFGEHFFAVLAFDPHGIVQEEWLEYEWRIGHLTAPLVFFDATPDVESEQTAADFAWHTNATDPVTYTCALDGGDPLPCVSPLRIPRLAVGEHSMEILAHYPPEFGQEGELLDPIYEEMPAIYDWNVVDHTPPDTAILYGPPATTTSTSAYFGFATNDPTAEIQCSLDWEGFGGCELHTVYEDLLDGSHILQVRAVDEYENADQSPEVYLWEIVRAAANTPMGNNVRVSLPMPNGSGGFSGTATVDFFQISQAGHTGIEALNGGPPIDLDLPGYGGARYFDIHTTAAYGEPILLCLPYNPADYVDGPARILHYGGSEWEDITLTNDPEAGKVCAEPSGFSLYALARGTNMDPIARIVSGPPLLSESGTATFEFAADVEGVQIQCSLDGLPFLPCESPQTFHYLETGHHKFEVLAVGPITFEGARLPTLYEWEVSLPLDTTPPETQIIKGPPLLTANSVVGFEFTGIDDQTIPLELEFECLLDGVLVGSCSSVLGDPALGILPVPWEVEVLEGAYGKHTVAIRAIDEMGNVDPTPATRTWTYVDINSPDTSIELAPEEETEGTIAIFEFTGEDINGNVLFDFECSLDGEDFLPCSTPHTVEGLTVGPHNFQVRSISPSGVVDSTPELVEWLIIPPLDLAPPETFIAHHPGAVSGPDVIFGFQSNELVEEFQCSVDGEEFSGCDSILELEALLSGQHTIEVQAIRYLTEVVDPTPAVFTWTVVGEPETTILTGPPAIDGRASATFTFTSDQSNVDFMCSVDGSMPVACESPFIAGPLGQDTHEFEVYAMNEFFYLDGERVQDIEPAVWEWEVFDVVPPDTTIASVVWLGPTDLVEPLSIRFELVGSDNNTPYFELEFECQLDGGIWDGCDQPFHYLPLEELTGGDHVLLVRAMDEWENVDLTPARYEFTTEAGPETTILTGPEPEIGGHEARFTFAADPSAGATLRVLARPRPVRAVRQPARADRRPVGRARARGAGEGPAGRGRPRAGSLELGERRCHAAGRHDPLRPGHRDQRRHRDLPRSRSTIPTRGCAARSTVHCSTGASPR